MVRKNGSGEVKGDKRKIRRKERGLVQTSERQLSLRKDEGVGISRLTKKAGPATAKPSRDNCKAEPATARAPRPHAVAVPGAAKHTVRTAPGPAVRSTHSWPLPTPPPPIQAACPSWTALQAPLPLHPLQPRRQCSATTRLYPVAGRTSSPHVLD